MKWSDYQKIAGGIYLPENAKPVSNRSKFIEAEGLSPKNLLKVPSKELKEDRMSADLRKFVAGKPILNEVAPLAGAIIPALVGAGEAAAGSAAATGAAELAGAAVAGETAAAGAAGSAGAAGATSLAADTAASSTSSELANLASNISINTNPSQTSHPDEQEAEK